MTAHLLSATWVSMVCAVLLAACSDHPRALTRGDDDHMEAVLTRLRPCTAIEDCEASCARGDAEQCLRAANSFSTGQGAPPDERQAAQRFARACELGSGAGCMFAGHMHEFAHGVAADLGRAAALYQRGCTLEDLGACYNLAVVLERGRGAPMDQPRDPQRDRARAAELYRRVCDAGSAVACAGAARLDVAAGKGMP